MKILALQKQYKDFRTAAQNLTAHGVAVSGPYRRQNGTFVFGVAGCVVTEEELVHFQRDGKLSANSIQELLAEIGKPPS
jgi:hypothetical protein